MTSLPSDHDSSLDGLRGLAALIVVIHHYALMLYPSMVFNDIQRIKSPLDTWVATTPLNLLIGGHFAVCLFFVLSAYVLTRKHVGQPNGLPLVCSIVKRYPRLGIPVFASVMVCFVALWLNNLISTGNYNLLLSGGSDIYHHIGVSFKQAWKEATTGALLHGSNTFNGALWTINIEFYGSIGVFVCLFLFDPLRWKSRLVLYAVALVLTWKTYYLAFVLGLLLADVQTHRPHWFRWAGTRRGVIAMLVTGGLLLGSVPIHFHDWQGTLYAMLQPTAWPQGFHVLGAWAVVFALLASPALQRLFSRPVFSFLGTVSFSMYLIHVTVLQYVGHTLVSVLTPHLGDHWAAGTVLLPTVALVLWLSWHFSVWVDRPAIRVAGAVARYTARRCQAIGPATPRQP